ncbi:MAG: KH domain-containing protein [Candidatus Atribacteria bacterium]|nr:KH domain-containing protein [Candidatus Atribacteria bacterium]
MKELIEFMIKGIVDFPEKVEIVNVVNEKTSIFEIKVDPEDVGKVIGKQGRNIKSIRSIMNAAAQKNEKRAIIEIIN